jgi:hypothetical protein
MYIDMGNTMEVPEAITLNLYGSVKLKTVEIGIRCNNITNRVNYCTGTVNYEGKVLYTRNAGINVHGFANVYF